MNDRDTFAAAALTGLLAGRLGPYSMTESDSYSKLAFQLAEAMVRERGVTEPMTKEKRAEVSFTLTDKEREAVEWAISAAENVMHPADTTLRKLLERLE